MSCRLKMLETLVFNLRLELLAISLQWYLITMEITNNTNNKEKVIMYIYSAIIMAIYITSIPMRGLKCK